MRSATDCISPSALHASPRSLTSTTAWPAASAQKTCMRAPPSAWSGLNVPSSKSRESSGREGNRVNESANSDKSSQLTSAFQGGYVRSSDVSCDDLSEFADSFTRFPSRPDDSRDFELGTFNPDHADGGARMHFFCADAAGHAVVEVGLRGDGCRALGEMQSVALRIPIQAAGVDEFLRQLRGIGKTLGASAHLPQAAS